MVIGARHFTALQRVARRDPTSRVAHAEMLVTASLPAHAAQERNAAAAACGRPTKRRHYTRPPHEERAMGNARPLRAHSGVVHMSP